jgi:NodT family efflux transporter outer membrane factor (OMF) lipoprotein
MRRPLPQFKASVLAAVMLAGCAVGPDFSPPAAPDVSAYDYKPLSAATADNAQKLQPGQDIPSEWWELFRSESLNRLVAQAIKENPDLASAEAALRVAEDNLNAAEGSFVPTVTGAAAAKRQKVASAASGGAAPSSIYSIHNASVGVSYVPDVWGGTRRTVEQLQAQVDAARFQKEAAYLALTSNVVTLAITEASLREQIDAVNDIIAAQEKVLNVFKLRFEAGAIAKSALVAQQSALATAKTGLPALRHKFAVTRHALSALVGQLPEKQPAAEFRLEDIKLPHVIPLSVPSKLVEQRPDVRAAQENMHAASAAIGVAQAARLPNIALTADAGSMATTIGKLFAPGGGFWSLGGSLAGTLFDAGTLANKEQAARDTLEMAAAQYRKAVLTAFQNVADTLHALQSDAEALNVNAEADKAAAESLALARSQFEAGATGIADLLIAQQAQQQARVAFVQAQAQRYADTAALFAALGGGWWNRTSAYSPLAEAAAPMSLSPADEQSEKGPQ